MTALIAIFSTVARPKRGGISATNSPASRPVAVTAAATRAAVGGTAGRPSVTPRSKSASMGSASAGAMAAGSRRERGLPGPREGRAILEPLAHLVQQALHRERL